jgi:Zn-dependent membrane protease YugP
MDSTWIILIPAMLFAKVSSAYRKYSAVGNRQGISGTRAARQILDNNGLSSVPIEIVAGKLTDHYDPRTRIMRLSPEVHNGTSIAAVSIAAHEAGHAIQHATSYAPLKIRNAIAPVVSIASNLAWPLLLIGLATGYLGLFDLGIVLFASALLFQAITLPVEFDASKRAIAQLQALAIIQDEEAGSAKKVLSAAAMTYVAAMAVSLANLLRLLMLRNRS